MDHVLQQPRLRNPFSSAISAQERISYVRDDEVNTFPVENYLHQQQRSVDNIWQQQSLLNGQQQLHRQSALSHQPIRPQQLNLHEEVADVLSNDYQQRSLFKNGNVAYIKPIARQAVSPLEQPEKFHHGQDEFMTYGTYRRLRSEFYDEVLNEGEVEDDYSRQLKLREESMGERKSHQRQYLEEDEERRQISRMEELGEMTYYGEGGDEFDEEIIEETITTRPKQLIQATVLPLTHHNDSLTKETCSVGVGDCDVNQYYLLDTGSRSVNPADFPPAYWERLSRYFSEEIKRKRPTCRDVASQPGPLKNRTVSQAAYIKEPSLLRNFGVCVKPITTSRGFNTDFIPSPDRRNCACMTDELDEYFARLLKTICEKYPNADREFINNLYRYSRTDISKFVHRLCERLEELRGRDSVEVTSKTQMFSTGVNVRPVMLNKWTLSAPSRQNLGTNTDFMVQRTMGTSDAQEFNEKPHNVSDFGVSTDCFIKHVETGSQVVLNEGDTSPPPTHPPPSPVASGHKVTTYRIRRISKRVDSEGHVSTKTYETSGEGLPPQSTLMASMDVPVKKAYATSPRPKTSTDSNSCSLAENVLVETWVDRSDPKPTGDPNLPDSYPPPKTTAATSPTDRESPAVFARTIEVARSPLFALHDDQDSTSSLHLQQPRKTPVGRTSTTSGTSIAFCLPNSPNIPLRNYTYKIKKEFRKAVEVLSSFYLTSPGGALTDELREHLETVRTEWFEIVSQTEIDLEQIEDLFAYLYNSAPELLYTFVRMPTSRGSTCLHYAVGHGAWRVVSLILNTGYADPNKKNAFGFSPIMIAAISDLFIVVHNPGSDSHCGETVCSGRREPALRFAAWSDATDAGRAEGQLHRRRTASAPRCRRQRPRLHRQHGTDVRHRLWQP
uniref:ANK_REP_REGION domain-containing protein n=1 Tax=Mesocestoides corti TaxID=53468 RepID=A0A5K3EH18_MESCO